MINLRSLRKTLALIGAPLMGLLAVGCAGADGNELGDTDTSESALTSVVLADVLAGGQFRCAEESRGDVVLTIQAQSSTRAKATFSGHVFNHHYPANDPPVPLRVSNGQLSGKRGINYGSDLGNGYYCGRGSAAYHCGPDRTDEVRFFVDGGELRCEVSMTRSEAYSNERTRTVRGTPTRYEPPPAPTTPSLYGNDTGPSVVQWGANALSGFKVSVPASVTLQEFGAVSTRAGAHVIMALYKDVGGRPGALVASTTSTELAGADQRIAPLETTTLAAGSYWLLATFDGPAHMRAKPGPSSWVAHPFGATLPASVPSMNTTANGTQLSIYFVTK